MKRFFPTGSTATRSVLFVGVFCIIAAVIFFATSSSTISILPNQNHEDRHHDAAGETTATGQLLSPSAKQQQQQQNRRDDHEVPEVQIKVVGSGIKGLVNKSGRVPHHVILQGCDQMLPGIPLSPLERELRRLLEMTIDILREKNIVGWPADGTLLGLVRNGRIMTDRDIDFNIHSTFRWCEQTLASLRGAFAKRGKVRMFKIAYARWNGIKIGRYAMVRMPPVYGKFGTGVDFNCVYTDVADKLQMHVHKGSLEVIPNHAMKMPLGFCLGYGLAIPCPHDPMAILNMFKPRYDGCMLFPHCTGDPLYGTKKCLTPHPPLSPRTKFVDVVDKLTQCGWVNLKKHSETESLCKEMLNPLSAAAQSEKCMPKEDPVQKWPTCFLQGYKD